MAGTSDAASPAPDGPSRPLDGPVGAGGPLNRNAPTGDVEVKDVASLPPGCTVVELVGEGSANAVFRLGLPVDANAEDRARLEGKLLRVQKQPLNPRSPPFPYLELFDFWKNTIKPNLIRPPQSLHETKSAAIRDASQADETMPHAASVSDQMFVDQELVNLPLEIIPVLNACLEQLEQAPARRRSKYIGKRVVEVPYGMLVEDMRPRNAEDHLIEFKPKWLAQSPSAPYGARRCRNCSIEVKKQLERKAAHMHPSSEGDGGRSPGAPTSLQAPRAAYFCPLDLLGDEAARIRAARSILETYTQKKHRDWSKDGLHGRLLAGLEGWAGSAAAEALFRSLRELQLRYDQKGPLHATPEDDELATAMTLRDCTVFLRLSSSPPGAAGDGAYAVEVKLVDFDKKRVETKWEVWKASELSLQPFYAGNEDGPASGGGPVCYLQRTQNNT